ncbi:MAG: serine hydrolase domain-containing protein [Litorimonas sp.]
MKSTYLIPLIFTLASCAGSEFQNASIKPINQDMVQNIDYKAIPRIAVSGEPIEAKTMSEYANDLGVPAATMALYKNGELIYQEFKGDGIGPDSLFQGASLAKSVSGAAIATLASREGISLDEDVSKYITSFDLTSLDGYQAPVTLRQLLSHTSRADVGGFEGYPRTVDIPTNLEVILGSEKSNTKRVSFSRPAGKWFYSGGGYQIAQAFAEDVSGIPFDQLAQELVIDPVGMSRSSYIQSMDPEAIEPLTPVSGFESSGPVEGGWHNYPELATAGLWTTAEDYGKFILAVMAAASGDTNTGILPAVAKEMLTVAGNPNPIRGYGLGFGILLNDDGSVQSFEHHGKNVGYRVSFSAFPKERAVSIVLTNHPAGLMLATESNRGFGDSLGYIDPAASMVTREPFTDNLRTRCLGVFAVEETPDQHVYLMEENNSIIFKNDTADYPLVHLGDGSFLYLATNAKFQCKATEQGVTLSLGSSTLYVKQEQ